MPPEPENLNAAPEPNPSAPPTASIPAGTVSAPQEPPAWAVHLSNQLAQMAQQNQQTQQQQQAPAPQVPQMPTDEMWTQRPNDAAQAVADARVKELLTPALASLQGLTQQTAGTFRALAQTQYADDFRRWGSEIDGWMAQVPVERRNLDAYEKVIKMVRGSHVDELTTEKARALMAQGAMGERSTGANGVTVNPVPGLDVQKLPENVQKLMSAHGLSAQDVESFCKRTNMTVEKWAENLTGGKMFTSSSPFQISMKEESLGVSRRFD